MIKGAWRKRPIARVGKEEGFTLIEAMVSMFILAIGMLAIGTGEITALTMNRRGADSLKAVAAMENILEMIRRNPSGVDNYNGLQTINPVVFSNPPTMAEVDFADWKRSVEAVTGETARQPFLCGARPVQKACGFITVGPRTVNFTKTVTIQIAWPARPNGISVMTTVQSQS